MRSSEVKALMRRFENKIAIVTGGNSGIGRAAAIRFAAEGAAVAIIARTQASGEAVVAEIRATGGNAVFIQADVGESEQVGNAMRAVLDHFGGFDVAFNCSGITGESKPFDGVSDKEFDAVLKVNLYGTFYCMRHEIRHFLKRGQGVIVNCSSTSGLVGLPNLGAYCASKHGVVGLTKSVALDYANKGIRVNAICPGGVATDMMSAYVEANPAMQDTVNAAHPIGRMASPEEVASLALWLCSAEASNVIGQAYAVDGGYTIR